MIIPELANIVAFILASTFLIISPGPAIVYILTRTVEKGYKAGVLSVLGVELGTLVHVILVAFGFSSVLIKSNVGFSIIKFGGIFYLTLLGFKRIYHPKNKFDQNILTKRMEKEAFSGGLIISLFNPKSILFFVVFLPQFVSISKKEEASQMMFLGVVFILIAIVWGMFVVLTYNKLKKHMKKIFLIPFNQDYIVGGIYIGIALLSLLFCTKL
ncbi:Threonine/homoserine/homoserine lactone efflux protein [Tenacibaculum sp. MAR_2009_124]|uniref:LysE family translocator n=1 Tax=Tenacibaculum sp. MAR_2009_124 TaxID=1250059 RepID=UPI000894BF90|nr:LysE family translocator [Tenacibaculum sp. MAR_2009_124]SEC40906.1 Threonine/homoserine/homoserine lactone efflux protein [Tenacibaculum sp. MAR_2009_124]